MKKKVLVSVLIMTLIACFAVFPTSYAATDKQDKLDGIKEEQADVSGDMEKLANEIKSQQKEVDKLEAAISAKQKEIDAAEVEIEKTKAAIDKRQKGLDNRLRTMYKNGSMGYLDVLFGSTSVSEFISNIEMIKKIYQEDQNTLESLEKQHKELKSKQDALKSQKAELNKSKATAEKKQSELQSKKNALQSKLEQLNKEAEKVSSEIAAMQSPTTQYEGGRFKWPSTSSAITSYYGYRIHPLTGVRTYHSGLDIGAGYGTPIYAAASGRIIHSGTYGGYGNCIIIDHGSGLSTLYGHASRLIVGSGAHVTKGQVIAYVGSTGWSTGPHLHFEVRVNGSTTNPMDYF